MKLEEFEGIAKEELSLIEVAKAILAQNGKQNVMTFNDIKNEVQAYLELSDEIMADMLPQFYTDLNIDGSFISLGENRWGLREWYGVDEINEEVSHFEDDDEDAPRRRKRTKKVNAFMDNDENAIDYSNDDPEDNDLNDTDDLYESEDESDISEYSKDLGDMDDEHLESAEENLTVIEDSETDANY